MSRLQFFYPGPQGSGPTGTEDSASNKACADAWEKICITLGKLGIQFQKARVWPGEIYIDVIPDIPLAGLAAVISNDLRRYVGAGYSCQVPPCIDIVRPRLNPHKEQ